MDCLSGDKKKIKSIGAENIIVKPPSGTMSISSISGLWKLRDARKGLDAVAEMRIEQNEYSIIALGSGWKGQGSFDGLKGYYDWRFSDGRMGRTNIEYDKYSDELHGYVKGSNINWDYIGARASK